MRERDLVALVARGLRRVGFAAAVVQHREPAQCLGPDRPLTGALGLGAGAAVALHRFIDAPRALLTPTLVEQVGRLKRGAARRRAGCGRHRATRPWRIPRSAGPGL